MKRTTSSLTAATSKNRPSTDIFPRHAVLVLALASGILATSCIYERPSGDEFYRTLWKSEEIVLGPFEVNSLTLEFLCNDGAYISVGDALTVYGTYSPDGNTTLLNEISAYINSDGEKTTVRFIEANRYGDTLVLNWQVTGNQFPFTTSMRRLSEYE